MNIKHLLITLLAVTSLSIGCQKPIQINTADSGEIVSITQPICPEIEILDYDDAYEVFNYDNYSKEGITCNDGKLYCYGQDNPPISVPENADGWKCRYVSNMPGDDKYQREYMYFYDYFIGDDYHRFTRHYIQWAFMKTWVCELDSGCLCGNSTCPQNGICIENQCFCNDTPYSEGTCQLAPPAPEIDYNNDDAEEDHSDEDKIQEFMDEYYSAHPEEESYRQKVDGRWIQYGSVMTHSFELDEPDDDEPFYDRTINLPTDRVWYDILTNPAARACDYFPIPDNVEDYICTFDGREDGCHEAPQMYVGSAGYRCNKPDGCKCGSITIPMHAGCRNGKADYDALYQTLACHHEINYYFSKSESENAKLVDDKGWCRCGRSTVPPNMKGYFCTSTGMICKYKAGCECGNTTCQYGETCISPGECQK